MYALCTYFYNWNRPKLPSLQVPKGHVWLSGDNVDNSVDSRTYGPVPYGLILGRVCYRVSVKVQTNRTYSTTRRDFFNLVDRQL